MAEQLLIRLDAELKRKLNRLATLEGKSSTQVVRDLIEEYVQRRDMPGYIDALWDRLGKGLRARGRRPGDVADAIRQVRKAKAQNAGGR